MQKVLIRQSSIFVAIEEFHKLMKLRFGYVKYLVILEEVEKLK